MRLFANPYAVAAKIMVEKVENIIDESIKYYCEKGAWPESKKDLEKYSRKIDLNDIYRLSFSSQGDKRVSINFDFSKFDYDNFEIESYKGFSSVYIQNKETCREKSYVEIYVSDFLMYNKKSTGQNRKPLNINTPIIIKFEDFNQRTIASIQHGYEV